MLHRLFLLLTASLALGVAVAGPVAAGGIEDEVRGLVMAGEIKPYAAIRDRVVSQVKADFVGAEFDYGTRMYRFRFLADGQVINVDVDARTGQRIRRSKNF